MSDKITKTVTFEIEKYGNCWNCECLTELKQYKSSHICIAFNEEIHNCGQCLACKDYLEAEKAKVYCDGCKHFLYDWMESECAHGNENICGDTFARDNWYCNNCTDREE